MVKNVRSCFFNWKSLKFYIKCQTKWHLEVYFKSLFLFFYFIYSTYSSTYTYTISFSYAKLYMFDKIALFIVRFVLILHCTGNKNCRLWHYVKIIGQPLHLGFGKSATGNRNPAMEARGVTRVIGLIFL